MLTFRPLPPAAEPTVIQDARRVLELAADHPDAVEIGTALDVLSHATLRIADLAETMTDAAAREALLDSNYGVIGTLRDAVSDLRHALECWLDNPDNAPGARREADYADYLIDTWKEARR